MKKILSVLLICWALFPLHSVLATSADTTTLPVLSRGHIQDLGDYPADGSWVASPNLIGTVGQSKRIEGFELKASDSLPTELELRYNVHVQNIGWLYDENDPTTWAKNGDYAGTRGDGLRIEAIKIVLLDAAGNKATDFHVRYQGHVENVGDLPADSLSWYLDGEQLGTVGSSQRLEALKLEIVKATTSTTYDKPGTYGPTSGSEKISQDVIITTAGVTLQNLTIDGNLIIDEAVGDGDVTLNNVTVTGELRVRGGGQNSIHINGGNYSKILVEQAPDGGVRIVATGLDGVPVVLSENATGETLILEGNFDSVTINAPDAVIKTQGQTSIKSLDVAGAAQNTAIDLGNTTTVTNLALSAPTKVTGTGTVSKAEIASDNVSFEKAPQDYTVEPGVVTPPVIPTPEPQPGGGSGGYTPPSKISLSVTTAPTVTLTKTYDGNTTTNVTNQALEASAVTGIVSGDDVQVVATATFANKNPGTDKAITVTYSLTGSDASKYLTPANKIITGGVITQKQLSVNTPNVTKVYDGSNTTSFPVTSVNGIVPNETVTINCTATFDDVNAGTEKSTSLTYSLTGADAGNYLKPGDCNISNGEITKKLVTITGTTVETSKTYNGNDEAAINNPGTSSDFVNGETVGIETKAYYDSKNAGNHPIYATYTLSGTTASNYTVTYTDPKNLADHSEMTFAKLVDNGTIHKVQLTVTGTATVTDKTYDGTKTASISSLPQVNGILDSDTVNLTATVTFANADAGTNKSAAIDYQLTSGTENYLPPQNDTTTATIKPRVVGINIDASNLIKKYDGNSQANVIAAFSQGTQDAVLSGDDLSCTVAAVYKDSNGNETDNVGTGLIIDYTITLTGTDQTNYCFSNNAMTITKSINGGEIAAKTVKITGTAVETCKTYNRSDVAAIKTSGTSTDIISGDMVTIAANAYYENNHAGTNKPIYVTYQLSGTDAANYQVAYDNPQTLATHQGISFIKLIDNGVINKAQLTTSQTPTIANKTYDGNVTTNIANTAVNTGDISGICSGDTVNQTATASFADANAGVNKPVNIAYQITGGTGSDNYLPPVNGMAIATISPLEFDTTRVIDSPSKEYDGTSKATVNVGLFITDLNVMQIVGPAFQNKRIAFEIVADYTDGSGNKKSAVGSNYTIAYSFKLSGPDAVNFKLTGSDTNNVITGSHPGSCITPKTLTISPPDIKISRTYDGTNKVYNQGGNEITLSYTVEPSQISGLAAGESLAITATVSPGSKDVGTSTVMINYSLPDNNNGNYLLLPQPISVTITPIQLTVNADSVPAVAITKKYDGTTATDITNKPVTVAGVLSNDTANVTATTTASYNDKNVGPNKPVTIAYSLSGDAAKNYLAPVNDTSKTAAITARTLGYTNVVLETMKKNDGTSIANIRSAEIDSTTASGDGVIHKSGTNTLETVSLGSYSADYYVNDLSNTTSTTGQHPIVITGTLTGADAGNYVMGDYVVPGQILAANAVISTPYNSPNWNVAGTLTAPAANFKLFYAKQDGATTFYGYDSTGQIYNSTDLSFWATGDKVTLDGKQLIGIDSDGSPIALTTDPEIDQYGNSSYPVYYWSGQEPWGNWYDYTTLSNIHPSNPTYYTDGTTDYLIYQNENNNVIKQVFIGYTQNQIGSYPGPSIPGSFNNSLLVYDGSNLMLYAY